MIEDFLSKIKNAVKELEELRRVSFNEKLDAFGSGFAKEVSWAPATRGGVGFRTRTMKQSGDQTIRFRPSSIALAISAGSTAFGLWLIARFVTPGISAEYYFLNFFGVIRAVYDRLAHQVDIAKISVTLFGLVFMTMGLVSLYKLLRPVRFDRFSRTFAKGYSFVRETSVSFNDIEAIQILSEHCRGAKNNSNNSNSFTSYELNLVLKNKSRLTVVDHADVSEIRRNADVLSNMLSVPVWDITKT